MVITYSIVLDVYQKLLDKKITFDEADRWAYKIMRLNDEKNLQYDPINKESELWDLSIYLLGIDMPSMEPPFSPMITLSDIIEFLREKDIEVSDSGELFIKK